MKRSIFNLIASLLLLGLGWLVPHSIFNVSLETSPSPDPALSAALTSAPAPESTIAPQVTPAPTDLPGPERDPYGEVYFTIITPKEYVPPAEPPVGVDESTARLARLPGSCVVGLDVCPAVETIETPFNMKDVYRSDGGGLVWSPDGRYGLLVTHPEDELSTGKTKDELDFLTSQSPSDFQVNPSTLYLYDAEMNAWQMVYRAERKFFYSPTWSLDGQWIAFQTLTSPWAFHPAQADDGIYLVRPDGSDVRQISTVNASILGWVGNSLLLRQVNQPYPSLDTTFVMLSLDGKITPLFDSQRVAFYSLAPDGGSLLAADAQGETTGLPIKSVDLLALDGSIIQGFGAFSNSATSIFPLVWSRDSSWVAFASSRRVYVGARTAQPSQGVQAGLPADGSVREVYIADDTYVSPSFWNFQFSADNKYLLMDVYDGMPRLMVVALETGQANEVIGKDMYSSEQATSYSWRHLPGK